MMAGVKPDSAQKASCKAAGNWFFNTSPTNNFPSTAPLPSSPKTKPNGDMLLTIPFPSYRQELEPVPKIQAMPGLSPQRARAAASKSLPTSISQLPDTILQSVFVEPPSAINIVFATIQSKYI